MVRRKRYLTIRCEGYCSNHFMDISPIHNMAFRDAPDSDLSIERTTYENIILNRIELYAGYCNIQSLIRQEANKM